MLPDPLRYVIFVKTDDGKNWDVLCAFREDWDASGYYVRRCIDSPFTYRSFLLWDRDERQIVRCEDDAVLPGQLGPELEVKCGDTPF